jgi:hypothetical protein
MTDVCRFDFSHACLPSSAAPAQQRLANRTSGVLFAKSTTAKVFLSAAEFEIGAIG